jgi:hypothetical protein
MKTKIYFAFRVDIWDDTGDSIVEHVAGVDDFEVAEATYRAAVARWPAARITLRQGSGWCMIPGNAPTLLPICPPRASPYKPCVGAPTMRRAASSAEPPAMLTALVAQSRHSTGVSRRMRRASELLPRLASAAVPEAEAPLLPDPRAGLSVEHMCHPEIRVHHDAPAARPC